MTKGKGLNSNSNLTVKMILALHKHLNIPTDTLLGGEDCAVRGKE